jgi:multiple antibiotic resistance protein
MTAAISAFLLAFPALFSIVNPPGAAFIFNDAATGFSHADRMRLANRVGFYSLCIMLGSLWGGAYVLNFFGISLGALRLAGGAVVALRAWALLSAPETQEARKQEQASESSGRVEEVAFFPLTLPFTTGPGTISVCVALGAERPHGPGVLWFFLGMSAAAAAIAVVVLVAYRSADRIGGWVGPTARRTIARLSAFLLLCIGTQIMINGFTDVATEMMDHWRAAG